jgi:hypothetical protein
LFLWILGYVVSWIIVILVDLASSCKCKIFFRHQSRMEGISRPSSSTGIDPCVNVELKGMSKMLLLEVIDRCPGRATCILKHICACFLTGSMMENEALTEHC